MKTYKRYIGNRLTLYAAFIYILFLIFPIIIILTVTRLGMDTSSIFISFICIFVEIIFLFYGYKFSLFTQFFSWCVFDKSGVTVITCFKKKYKLYYSQCTDIGIIRYKHSILNSSLGTKQFFICISEKRITQNYIEEANRLLPNKGTVKVSYNKKTKEYLLNVLPNNLRHQFERNIKLFNK